MIDGDDLKAAVRAGLLSETQAASLNSLADSRRGVRENLRAGDEPFELFRGLNEIFIVLGLLILCGGWAGLCMQWLSRFDSTALPDIKGDLLWVSLASAAILWALSEYFIRKRRMIAPAIILSALFAGNAIFGVVAQFAHPVMIAFGNYSSLPAPLLGATAAVLVFWVRFRVPILAGIIALMFFAAAIIAAAPNAKEVTNINDLFLLSANGSFAWITLAIGLATFATAMAFDMSDPHRVTRRSTTGFWLHVVSAPMLVNTVAMSLLETDNNALLVILMLGFGMTAMIIDRRSFVMTALIYIIIVAQSSIELSAVAHFIFALGIILLALGAFWENIRAVLLRLLAPILPLDRLPPSLKDIK